MTEAEEEREKLREDSEARDIIHDINSLRNKDEIEKTRWVWELLQNAKDTDEGFGVDVTFKMDGKRVTFTHNGAPFETKHLIAILHKKSTKSLGGDDGTTGKYGTGFVTTHILSKKLQIAGIHQDYSGKRKFDLEIDRSSVSLEETEALMEMKNSIKTTFNKINSLSSLPTDFFNSYEHSFTYTLSDSSAHYAEKGLDELEKNAIFTLLINKGGGNRKKIKSITISRNGDAKRYEIEPKPSKIIGLNYLTSGDKSGLLFKVTGKVTFGIPVEEIDQSYALKSLENQAVLFKEFPLIGTESFNLPVFVQHNDFKPTEPRDGIVTHREVENEEEFIPDANRLCLLDFKNEYILFLDTLINAQVQNLHFLALSGLPIESKNYTGKEWYISKIQIPIREYLNAKKLVSTVSGDLLKIEEVRFPFLNPTDENSFYKVIASLIPNRVPSRDSITFWDKTINQQIENWPKNISISLEQLLGDLPELLNKEDTIPYNSLKVVYQYLQSINSTLGEIYPIYPNEKKELKLRDEIKLYPLIDDEIKIVSKKLGRDLDIEFLHKEFKNDVPGIAAFNLEQFYKSLNNDVISKIDPDVALEEQVYAILHINTLFKTDRAAKRELWLAMIKELLPTKFGTRKLISIDYENYYQPAELWTAKYICWLIQKEINVHQFANVYFEGNLKTTYDWLNRFLNYIIESREDVKAFLTRYNIIPVQHEGKFKPYNESLYKEDNPAYFDKDLKTIAKEKCGFNPEEYLIRNEIDVIGLRLTTVEFVTKHIDKLFEDDKIASKVGLDGELHDVFNVINSWFDNHFDSSSYLKTFASKRNFLYVISLGDGFSKHIKALKDSGKSMEDISKLAEIRMTVEQMKQLETVANELGHEVLILKAQEMIAIREQRARWKKIGKTAEDAFKKVFEGIDMEMELFNPDLGKDFEIVLKAKGYSIEIKNVIRGKENVKMSILQGRTAVMERDNYTLCVLTRPDDEAQIDEAYFTENSNFVIDIGYQIGDKIINWDKGLMDLSLTNDIKVNLDNKTESVYINRPIWKNARSFSEFIIYLESYFAS